MKSSQKKMAEIQDLLDQRIEEWNQSQKRILIFGIIILVLIGGYFFRLHSFYSRYMNTQNFSGILSMKLSQQIAPAAQTLEKTLMSEIPGSISLLKKTIKKEMTLWRIKQNIYLVQCLSEISQRVDLILKNEIQMHGSPYRQKIAEQVRLLADPKTAQLALIGIPIVINESIFKEIKPIMDLTSEKIKNLEVKIEKALKEEPENENEILIKKFITYWYHFYQNNFRMK
jgi:hypothetical protein